MGTFGAGCCTGGHKFARHAGWTPPTLKPPTLDSTAPSESACDPTVTTGDDFLSFGATGTEWPKWVKEKGCGFLSILALNDKVHKNKLGGRKVLTPKHIKEFADCMCVCLGKPKDCKEGARDGFNTHLSKDGECRKKCKKELMRRWYEIEVDLSSYSGPHGPPIEGDDRSIPSRKHPPSPGPSSYCPPLCLKQEIVLGYNSSYKCWVQNPKDGSWAGPSYRRFPHSIQCYTVSCVTNLICFVCQNQPPQGSRIEKVCFDGNGHITHRELGKSEFGPAGGVGQPGSCAKKMQSILYRGGDDMTDPTSKYYVPNRCCEHMYSWIRGGGRAPTGWLSSVITEVPCPPEGDK